MEIIGGAILLAIGASGAAILLAMAVQFWRDVVKRW